MELFHCPFITKKKRSLAIYYKSSTILTLNCIFLVIFLIIDKKTSTLYLALQVYTT